jgi:hypothetical protein
MKSAFAALLLFCLSYSPGLWATQLFVYNHGYVLGELTGVDFIGPNRRTIIGSVSVGNSGLHGGEHFRDQLNGDYLLSNPWSFCGDQSAYGNLSNYIGEFVVIEYKTPKDSSLLACQSTNEIIGVYPVSRNNPSIQVLESTKISISNKPYGVSVGRIVNAQKSDKHDKNWSIVIQVGNSGSDFRYLKIVDSDMYDFALDCLATGTRVKAYHVERIHGTPGRGRSESYAWRIETKPGL